MSREKHTSSHKDTNFIQPLFMDFNWTNFQCLNTHMKSIPILHHFHRHRILSAIEQHLFICSVRLLYLHSEGNTCYQEITCSHWS